MLRLIAVKTFCVVFNNGKGIFGSMSWDIILSASFNSFSIFFKCISYFLSLGETVIGNWLEYKLLLFWVSFKLFCEVVLLLSCNEGGFCESDEEWGCCRGEVFKFNVSPTFKVCIVVFGWIFIVFIVFELLLFVFELLLFEFAFWPNNWLTIVLVKLLIWSGLVTTLIIFWKGFIFWVFWEAFVFWLEVLLFFAFSWALLTSSSLLKTKWIVVSSLSTNLSKYSSSLNCFPLFNNLCLFGSILYISSNFFFKSLILIS